MANTFLLTNLIYRLVWLTGFYLFYKKNCFFIDAEERLKEIVDELSMREGTSNFNYSHI